MAGLERERIRESNGMIGWPVLSERVVVGRRGGRPRERK